MKYFLASLATLICLVSHAQDTAARARELEYEQYMMSRSAKYKGKPFGKFEVMSSGKKKFSNADLQGKIVFVNFWFEACAPCIAEMDGLNQLYDSLKNNPQFLFLSFTYEPDSVVAKVKSSYKIGYPVFHIDRQECFRLNFNNGFPSSFCFRRERNRTAC